MRRAQGLSVADQSDNKRARTPFDASKAKSADGNSDMRTFQTEGKPGIFARPLDKLRATGTLRHVNPQAVIPIRPEAAADCPTQGCEACASVASPPAAMPSPQTPPLLEGDPAQLALALAGLEEVRPFIRQLHCTADEVSLTLHPLPRCAGAQLVQRCFLELRRRLPDTDIYVTPS